MKCEKCGANEANFFYTATINAETIQSRLCESCAREEGFGEVFDWDMRDAFGGFIREPFGLLGEFFGGRAAFGDMIAPMALKSAFLPGQRPAAQPSARPVSKIPDDAGGEIRAKRELSELRHRLDSAVKDENYELAIELRDKIKELDKQ